MALDFAARIHALTGFDADSATASDTGDDFDNQNQHFHELLLIFLLQNLNP